MKRGIDTNVSHNDNIANVDAVMMERNPTQPTLLGNVAMEGTWMSPDY